MNTLLPAPKQWDQFKEKFMEMLRVAGNVITKSHFLCDRNHGISPSRCCTIPIHTSDTRRHFFF